MRPCFRVRLASRAITRFYDDLLVPSGLRVPHFVVLVGVFRGFGTMLTALGGVLGMDRTSLSKALRPLLRRGFVMRVPTTDRRRWTMTLARPKSGLVPDKTGDLILADIGIPRKTYERAGVPHVEPFGNRFRVHLNQHQDSIERRSEA